MFLPEAIKFFLTRLNDNGYEAYVVGGAVRDEMSGVKVHDYDLTTSAKTDEVKRVFADCKVIATGEKHGTLTVIKDGTSVEITTFRAEKEYSDSRHPDGVTFIKSLDEDLKRRDFTINAMAYSPEKGLIDIFGGLDDIKNKIIRTVGNPEERFKEDALRILRAVRFEAQTGFDIEKNTKKAMSETKCLLQKVSVERIFAELTKILTAPYAAKALFCEREIIFEVLPEIAAEDGFEQKSLSHLYTVYEHTVKAVENGKGGNEEVMWALLLHDSGKPFTFYIDDEGRGHFPGHMKKGGEITRETLKRLKAPTRFINRVTVLVENHDRSFDDDKYRIKKFMSEYGAELFNELLKVKAADCYAHSEHGIQKYKHCHLMSIDAFDEILKNGECYKQSDLKISGDDLIDIGVKGINVGRLKYRLFELVLKNKLKNDKEELLKEAQRLKKYY